MHGKFPVPGTGDILVRSLNSKGVLFSELLLLLTVCKSKYDIRFSKSLKAVKSIYDFSFSFTLVTKTIVFPWTSQAKVVKGSGKHSCNYVAE